MMCILSRLLLLNRQLQNCSYWCLHLYLIIQTNLLKKVKKKIRKSWERKTVTTDTGNTGILIHILL